MDEWSQWAHSFGPEDDEILDNEYLEYLEMLPFLRSEGELCHANQSRQLPQKLITTQ